MPDKNDSGRGDAKNINDEDKVGYKKPPRASQFKKGQSGNPRGRAKKKASFPNLDVALAEELSRKIKVSDQSGTHLASKFDVLIKQFVNKAVSGQVSSLKMIMPWLAQAAKLEEAEGRGHGANEALQDVRARIAARLERIAKAQARDEGESGGK